MISSLFNRRILLIISGGIAAYKSLELIRRLKDDGAQVRCILTEGGQQFITPLSVTALSGEPCLTKLFAPEDEKQFGHIRLSRETDLIVVAPTSANMIAKMAHGLADTLASAVLLATNKPVMIAPAMNSQMWQHAATQANITTLATRGIQQIGPASGFLACGEEGAGRMVDPDILLQAIRDHFGATGSLSGKKILVTSGPTYEPLDPVRFIGNRSSGKQGHAIAAACAAMGADVTLVSGPTALPDPAGVRTHRVQTAREMLAICQQALPVDVAICAAAVADWRPVEIAEGKIKKGGASPTIELTENPDILATLAAKGPQRPSLVIGFAAETDHLEQHAAEKFERKACDWLLANSVAQGRVFGEEENEVVLFKRDPANGLVTEPWERGSKTVIAEKLAQAISLFLKN